MLATDFAYVYGPPQSRGLIRQQLADFQVSEMPAFTPEGEGEHCYLHIRKAGENTDWVARQLANFCQVPLKDVGYAGKKDRHAITEQWFSVRLGLHRNPVWSLFGGETIQVLQAVRHPRKLRLGMLAGNRFLLRLREVSDASALQARLAQLRQGGVPNYFGEQRFGREGGNLEKGLALLRGELKERQRHKKGLYISAVRSWLFNQYVSERIRQGLWQQIMPGDVLLLTGSDSFFNADPQDGALAARLASADIQLSAPLWGRGQLPSQAEAGCWEQQIAQPWQALCERLEHLGLRQERRSISLPVQQLEAVQEDEQTWRLHFTLPRGAFATSVLRELCQVSVDRTTA